MVLDPLERRADAEAGPLRSRPVPAQPPPTGEHAVRLRIVIEDAVPGVVHSLQDAKSVPMGAQRAVVGQPLVFEFAVRAKATDDGVRLLGEHVRREGPERASSTSRSAPRPATWRRPGAGG